MSANVGSSSSNRKTVPCRNCRSCQDIKDHGYGDTWRFEYTATTVTAIRTDASHGWGHALKVWCVPSNPLLHSTGLEVATFGAPATRRHASCTMPGIRYAATDDPVASNGPSGMMTDFNHDVTRSSEMYKSSYCKHHCVFFCCPVFGTSHHKVIRQQTCTRKSGGCSNWLVCLYNFATEHGSYGEYF